MANQIKTCGIKSISFIDICAQAGADYIGFVNFEKSPRHIDIEALGILIKHTPPSVKTVVLTVNPNPQQFAKIASFRPDYIQLHGNESVEFCQLIKSQTEMKIIKAIATEEAEDVAQARKFENHVDILLFDAKPIKGAELPGGNGQAFNWSLLKDQHFNCQTMLAGGLCINNVEIAMAQSGINSVDLSSALEIKRGIKDKYLIEEFIKKVKG